MRLLGLKTKPDNEIKSKAMKYIFKKILPDYKYRCLILLNIKTMETYCVTCKKNTRNKNSTVKRTKRNRLLLVSNCVVCGKKKSGFIKSQEVH